MVRYGPVPDQAGLGGLVDRILSSGLEVVETRRLPVAPDEPGATPSHRGDAGGAARAGG
jgi:hypothetical protein